MEISAFPMSMCMPTYLSNDEGSVLIGKPQQTAYLSVVTRDVGPEQDEGEGLIDDGYTGLSWVSKNLYWGYVGERIAKTYLSRTIGSVEWVSKERKGSNKGYDLRVGEQKYEVKTSTASSCFYITVNELYVSTVEAGLYSIFFIAIDIGKKKATGYIINDPFAKFNICQAKLFSNICGNKVIFSPNSFKVNIEKYISEIEGIDLSEILQEISTYKIALNWPGWRFINNE